MSWNCSSPPLPCVLQPFSSFLDIFCLITLPDCLTCLFASGVRRLADHKPDLWPLFACRPLWTCLLDCYFSGGCFLHFYLSSVLSAIESYSPSLTPDSKCPHLSKYIAKKQNGILLKYLKFTAPNIDCICPWRLIYSYLLTSQSSFQFGWFCVVLLTNVAFGLCRLIFK